MRNLSEERERIIPATIIPMAVTRETVGVCYDAIRTHGLRHPLIVVLNNSDKEKVKWLQQFSWAPNLWWRWLDGDYNLNACYNQGLLQATTLARATHVFLANADVIFHPNWDDILIRQWEELEARGETPGILTAYSGLNPAGDQGPCYRITAGSGVQEVHTPLMQCAMMNSLFSFDEQFDHWNTDCDLWLFMKSCGKKMFVSEEARVDHIQSVFSDAIGPQVISVEESNRRMKAKWGNLYHGC